MTDNLKEREAFEAWFSDQGQYPKAIQRRDDGYLLSTAQSAWDTWQARAAIDAALAARGAVPAGLPEIDYEALIKAAYARDKKWAQGTNGCIAFKHGAEWFRDQVASAPQQVAQPWMPIETAPKDGTRVLLVIDHGEWGDKIWTGLWANGWMVSYGKTSNPPTHWMPLPAEPQPKD